MSLVELTMLNGDSIYINPEQVNCLRKSDGPEGDKATTICFGPSHQVVVKGDIDSIAFHLFPNDVR